MNNKKFLKTAWFIQLLLKIMVIKILPSLFMLLLIICIRHFKHKIKKVFFSNCPNLRQGCRGQPMARDNIRFCRKNRTEPLSFLLSYLSVLTGRLKGLVVTSPRHRSSEYFAVHIAGLWILCLVYWQMGYSYI